MLSRVFPGIYEGWLVVAASALFSAVLAGAVHYGFGTVFEPLRSEFGWGVGATAVAFSLRTEVSGIAAPVIGVMVDRLGPRPALTFGVATSGLAILLMSFTENIWWFYGTMVLLSIGMSATGGTVALAAIATWFRRRRTRAMALLTMGGGLAALLTPLMAVLVEEAGWRSALRIVAVLVVVAGLLPILETRTRPAGHRQPIDGLPLDPDEAALAESENWGVPVGRAIRSRSFVLYAVAVAGMGFTTTAVVVLQIPFLESRGMSSTVAAATVAVFGLVSVVGRWGFAALADARPKRFVLAATLATVVGAVVLFPLIESIWLAIPLIGVFAIGFGGAVPVRPALVADYYGTRWFGTVFGITMSIRTLGAALGPLVVGALVDVTGGYSVGWLVAAAVAAGMIPLLLLATPPHELIAEHRRLSEPVEV